MDLRALIFMPALVGAAICAFVFFTFAARYYLTALESTAAGAKHVVWESEDSVFDIVKPIYLSWLIVLWLGPAYIIGRVLANRTHAEWVGFAVPVLVAWLLYPVSQLSSLSASSVWMPLTPQIFARLVQKPLVTAVFYVLTLPVFALGWLAFKWAFLTAGEWELLFAGTPLLALAGLLYARLLGRLAFALRFTKDLLKRKKKKRPRAMDATPPAAREPAPAVVDAPDMTPIMTPLDGELMGYSVLMSDDPPAPKKRVKAEVMEDEPTEPARKAIPAPPRTAAPASDGTRSWTDDDEDASAYGVNASEVKAGDRIPEAVLKPTADELALHDRRDAPKAPKRVWTAEVLVFLAQPGTVSALVVLSAIGTFAGVMVRVARQFNPVAGGE